jgi:heme/copper-type cytochrome/quinol oxidase subunit 3
MSANVTTTTNGQAAVTSRVLFVSIRLFVAADAFFWLGFFFAYLYLRALDSNLKWHPHGIDPSVALGTVLAACVILAAGALRYGADRAVRAGVVASLVLMLVAFVCQGVQLFDPGFSPSYGGGYGAVFVGYSAAMFAHLLGALYWVETLVVDRDSSATARAEQARVASVFVTFLAGVSLVAYILIYLV